MSWGNYEKVRGLFYWVIYVHSTSSTYDITFTVPLKIGSGGQKETQFVHWKKWLYIKWIKYAFKKGEFQVRFQIPTLSGSSCQSAWTYLLEQYITAPKKIEPER